MVKNIKHLQITSLAKKGGGNLTSHSGWTLAYIIHVISLKRRIREGEFHFGEIFQKCIDYYTIIDY